jgi:hypothetical protein
MSNLMEIRPVGATLMHADRRADGHTAGQTQTDGHNKGAVREYSNSPTMDHTAQNRCRQKTNST